MSIAHVNHYPPISTAPEYWRLYYEGNTVCETIDKAHAQILITLANRLNQLHYRNPKGESSMASFAVFVDAINQDAAVGVIVSASNGGNGGQPKVIWKLPHEQVLGCHIGKRYKLTIDEYPIAPD